LGGDVMIFARLSVFAGAWCKIRALRPSFGRSSSIRR
jgi:hypothetical protein